MKVSKAVEKRNKEIIKEEFRKRPPAIQKAMDEMKQQMGNEDWWEWSDDEQIRAIHFDYDIRSKIFKKGIEYQLKCDVYLHQLHFEKDTIVFNASIENDKWDKSVDKEAKKELREWLIMELKHYYKCLVKVPVDISY